MRSHPDSNFVGPLTKTKNDVLLIGILAAKMTKTSDRVPNGSNPADVPSNEKKGVRARYLIGRKETCVWLERNWCKAWLIHARMRTKKTSGHELRIKRLDPHQCGTAQAVEFDTEIKETGNSQWRKTKRAQGDRNHTCEGGFTSECEHERGMQKWCVRSCG